MKGREGKDKDGEGTGIEGKGRTENARVLKDTEAQRHGDTETQRHRDTETQRHRDTETQRHSDTETQRHRDTETQRHSDTETLANLMKHEDDLKEVCVRDRQR